MIVRPLLFKAKYYGDLSSPYGFPVTGVPGVGIRSSSSPYLLCPSLLQSLLWSLLAPDYVSVLPTIFIVASCLHLAVESWLWQALGHFLGYYTDISIIYLCSWDKVSLDSPTLPSPPKSLSSIFLRYNEIHPLCVHQSQCVILYVSVCQL